MKKIRVMIVEDSSVVREYLQYIVNRDPRLEVVAAAASAEEALRIFRRIAPDIVTMDIRLPGMNGFEATQVIMSEFPTPIVVISASVEAEDLKISMNALRAGALSIVEKPSGMTNGDYESVAEKICTQIAIMSQIKVIRQRIERGVEFKNPGAAPTNVPRATICRPTPAECSYQALGVVASTGGPNALVTLFKGLGEGFPLPILLVQHISAGFLNGFVSWLQSVSPFETTAAEEGETPVGGHIYVAPADRHLKLERGRLRLDSGEPVSSQRPSGTVLFQSMARSLGTKALGVLLTGMGDDGAAGLLEIRDAGGYTIAEDQSTAVVYGMPAQAIKLGAACESLPIHAVPHRVRALAVERRSAV